MCIVGLDCSNGFLREKRLRQVLLMVLLNGDEWVWPITVRTVLLLVPLPLYRCIELRVDCVKDRVQILLLVCVCK